MLQAGEAVVHSSVDPSVVRVSPHNTHQQCLSLGRARSAFWTALQKSSLFSHVEIENESGKATITSFQTAWDKRNFSEMWGLAYGLSGRPVGPRSEFTFKWLLVIWVFKSGLSFSPFLGTTEAVVLR